MPNRHLDTTLNLIAIALMIGAAGYGAVQGPTLPNETASAQGQLATIELPKVVTTIPRARPLAQLNVDCVRPSAAFPADRRS